MILSLLYRPDINYSLISRVYAILSLVAFGLYIIEFHFQPKSTLLVNIANDIAGSYIVFAVFIPCYFWSLLMLRQAAGVKATSKEGGEKPKEE